MAAVEKKVHAMLFELYGVRLRFRHPLQDLDAADADFISARRARLAAYFAADFDARFLREPAQRGKRLRLLLLRDHALHQPGPISKNGEQKLAGFAQVVEPAAQGDLLAVVFPGFFDGDYAHRALVLSFGFGRGERPLDAVERGARGTEGHKGGSGVGKGRLFLQFKNQRELRRQGRQG